MCLFHCCGTRRFLRKVWQGSDKIFFDLGVLMPSGLFDMCKQVSILLRTPLIYEVHSPVFENFRRAFQWLQQVTKWNTPSLHKQHRGLFSYSHSLQFILFGYPGLIFIVPYALHPFAVFQIPGYGFMYPGFE